MHFAITHNYTVLLKLVFDSSVYTHHHYRLHHWLYAPPSLAPPNLGVFQVYHHSHRHPFTIITTPSPPTPTLPSYLNIFQCDNHLITPSTPSPPPHPHHHSSNYHFNTITPTPPSPQHIPSWKLRINHRRLSRKMRNPCHPWYGDWCW